MISQELLFPLHPGFLSVLLLATAKLTAKTGDLCVKEIGFTKTVVFLLRPAFLSQLSFFRH